MNVRICCDGEEEIGGHSIVDFLAQDERGADACVIFDGGMTAAASRRSTRDARARVLPRPRAHRRARPALGDLRRRRAERDARAHADALGGAAAGRPLPEPLRKGIARADGRGARRLGELPPGADELAEQGARPADPRAAEEFYVRTFAEPALDVNGVEGGSPQLQKTVLPVHAEANMSIRLAPGPAVEDVAPEVERLLREAAPAGADVEVDLWSSAPPGLVPPDSPAIRSASRPSSGRSACGRGSSARAGRSRSFPRSPTAGSRP